MTDAEIIKEMRRYAIRQIGLGCLCWARTIPGIQKEEVYDVARAMAIPAINAGKDAVQVWKKNLNSEDEAAIIEQLERYFGRDLDYLTDIEREIRGAKDDE